jgi:hypothetical protein
MGNGNIRGTGSGPASNATPVGSTDVHDAKTPDAPPKTEGNQKQETSPTSTGRNPGALKHDPAVALKKATLTQASGLKKPSAAQMEEIRSAIKDGKKEEAIKLTIKYYNIDTSGAAEVHYAEPKKTDSAQPESRAGSPYQEIGTATKKKDGKIVIDIGDESFRFKKTGETGEGTPSPEWLASAIYHESFHAKNHFTPNQPQIYTQAPEQNAADKPRMSQEEVGQEIEAYAKEQSQASKLGLSPDMLQEIQNRQNKLYAELTPENREIARQMLQGRQPWPH